MRKQIAFGRIDAAALWNAIGATLLSTTLVLTSVPSGHAQTIAGGCPSGQVAPNEVLAELRKLRIEIAEYRIQSRTEDLARLEQALQQVRNERLRFEEEERARAQQLAEVETFLATPGQALTPEQRTQFEAMKTGITGTQSDKLRAEHAAALKREAEADDRLRVAYQQLQQLTAMKNELANRKPSGN